MSHVTLHKILVGGESVMNGATPSSSLRFAIVFGPKQAVKLSYPVYKSGGGGEATSGQNPNSSRISHWRLSLSFRVLVF